MSKIKLNQNLRMHNGIDPSSISMIKTGDARALTIIDNRTNIPQKSLDFAEKLHLNQIEITNQNYGNGKGGDS
jgi:hypothetical protein